MLRNKNIRFEKWHNGYRKNITGIKDGEQVATYDIVPATKYYVGLSSKDNGEYFEVACFDTNQDRSDWIASYKLFEKMK